VVSAWGGLGSLGKGVVIGFGPTAIAGTGGGGFLVAVQGTAALASARMAAGMVGSRPGAQIARAGGHAPRAIGDLKRPQADERNQT